MFLLVRSRIAKKERKYGCWDTARRETELRTNREKERNDNAKKEGEMNMIKRKDRERKVFVSKSSLLLLGCSSLDLAWPLVNGFLPHHFSVYLISLGRKLVCMSTHSILTPTFDGQPPFVPPLIYSYTRTLPLIYSYTHVQTLLAILEQTTPDLYLVNHLRYFVVPCSCDSPPTKPSPLLFLLRISALLCASNRNRSSHHHHLKFRRKRPRCRTLQINASFRHPRLIVKRCCSSDMETAE